MQKDPLQLQPEVVQVLKQFRVIFSSVRRHFQCIEDECHISGSQLWALSHISKNPGIRVTDLAKLMSVHQSTASNLIENLSQKGLIQRQRSKKDQRIVQLLATPQGDEIVNNAPRPLRGVLPEALTQLDAHTLQEMNNCLSQLIQTMDRVDAEGENIPLADL